MPEQTLNVELLELLERVKAHIRAHPEQFDMLTFGRVDDPCGTTACIAGWSVILSGQTNLEKVPLINAEALRVLGLNDRYDTTHRKECPLFYDSDWPEDLRKAFLEAEILMDYPLCASIAGEAIDRFIAGNGSFDPPVPTGGMVETGREEVK